MVEFYRIKNEERDRYLMEEKRNTYVRAFVRMSKPLDDNYSIIAVDSNTRNIQASAHHLPEEYRKEYLIQAFELLGKKENYMTLEYLTELYYNGIHNLSPRNLTYLKNYAEQIMRMYGYMRPYDKTKTDK